MDFERKVKPIENLSKALKQIRRFVNTETGNEATVQFFVCEFLKHLIINNFKPWEVKLEIQMSHSEIGFFDIAINMGQSMLIFELKGLDLDLENGLSELLVYMLQQRRRIMRMEVLLKKVPVVIGGVLTNSKEWIFLLTDGVIFVKLHKQKVDILTNNDDTKTAVVVSIIIDIMTFLRKKKVF